MTADRLAEAMEEMAAIADPCSILTGAEYKRRATNALKALAALRAAQPQAEAWRHLRDEAKEAVERAREINALGAEITAPAEGDSRSAFESWVTRDRGLPAYVLDRYTDGRYCDLGIDRDWKAWSAALASQAQPKGTEAPLWQAVADADLDEIEAWAMVDRKTILPVDLFKLRNLLAHMVREVRATRAAAPSPAPAAGRYVAEISDTGAAKYWPLSDEQALALAQAPAVAPTGFVLMPNTLTREMWEATSEMSTYVAFDRARDDYAAMLDAAPAASIRAPAVADESAEAEFEVWEGDELFAGTSGPRAQAWAELQRYAAQCKGVIRVFEVSRVERTLSYVPVQENSNG